MLKCCKINNNFIIVSTLFWLLYLSHPHFMSWNLKVFYDLQRNPSETTVSTNCALVETSETMRN